MRISVRAFAAWSVLCVGVATGGVVSAQTVPAEQPPASFVGDQYIDSDGCVFIRAGFGGQTNWVPRVSGERQHICGQQPSLPSSTTAAIVAAPAPAAPPPLVIAPAPAPVVLQPVAPAPQAPVFRTAPAAPATVAPAMIAPATGGCPGMDAIANQYMQGDVRCGPQAVHPGDAARRGAALQNSGAGQSGAFMVPAGYRAAFDDGRFNAFRGVGTAAGEAQMDLIWSRSVPRRLIDRTSMTDVTALFPALIYPFTDMSAQEDELRALLAAQTLPARAAPAASEIDQYVQAARFADRADADQARAVITAAGLPTRMGRVQGDDGIIFVVLAGPFADPGALQTALNTTRSAGFADAVTRN